MDQVFSEPSFARYTHLVTQRGDFGLVAESAHGWAGVAWLLFLPASDPGFGFVAPGVGEVSVSVQADYRGAGLGRELLTKVLALAKSREHERVSLSVESDNPARRLYESIGFADAGASALAGTMVKRLERGG
ncbi:GNAT family N-acetyltransferase [Ornithinimicrobium sp. INDO-MA30-4]|uniref:GNAT family N-acetyltransferase n=1 Tax=Ornithinimicrobium sp. INDO-MA30-4 TaxID=2908651 RepID=UPI001F28D010|nr:GNAT family N-acetyltransferase [Ornithinimicrobium sp. INDO-MA30-4]UJH71604.1 GNAT family N-acetyltransferase [Ornithinimicrobium sp. INDO-MA30-4]